MNAFVAVSSSRLLVELSERNKMLRNDGEIPREHLTFLFQCLARWLLSVFPHELHETCHSVTFYFMKKFIF